MTTIITLTPNQNQDFIAHAEVGNIDYSIIDSLEFETDDGDDQVISHISDDVFVIAYRGSDINGFLKTVDITSDGTIISVLDILEYDTIAGFTPDIANVSEDVFVIAYRGADTDGFLKTVDIMKDGTIGSVIDTLEYDTELSRDPDIIKVSQNVFAIVYRGPSVDGFLKTVDIENDGTIGTVIDTLEFDTIAGLTPNIINVSDNIFAIVYQGPDTDGFLKTVSIMRDGTIGSVIDTLEFDVNFGLNPDIINVYGKVFAISYQGADSDGVLKTFIIRDDGMISSIIDTLEFDTANGTDPDIINLSENVFAIVYKGPGVDGFFKTVDIANDGTIGLVGEAQALDSILRAKPTFGRSHETGELVAEGGFTANGQTFDITDNWHTDFKLMTLNVGERNSFSAKTLSPYGLQSIEFMFGIPQVGSAHEAEAVIEITLDRNLNVINILTVQKDNLIDPDSVLAKADIVRCRNNDVNKNCHYVTVSATFNEAPLSYVFALKGIDFTKRSHLTYLNEGLEVTGDSLNPATTMLISANKKGAGLMLVTQIDKRYDMWISESGIEFERNSFGTFIKTTPVEVVRDDPMVKVMTRLNSNFEAMKINEMYRAIEVFDSSLLQKELPDFIPSAVGQKIDKRNDPEFLKKLVYEEIRATDNLTQMWEELYPSDFYESGEVTNPSRLISYGL